jgi:hypothetical protein
MLDFFINYYDWIMWLCLIVGGVGFPWAVWNMIQFLTKSIGGPEK